MLARVYQLVRSLLLATLSRFPTVNLIVKVFLKKAILCVIQCLRLTHSVILFRCQNRLRLRLFKNL